ncbi:hypothetical protein C8R44DRAFT_807877 [Mycena epipterygia]|nr:hypothetical protein C8R44DRAFT_807877 [Mycena epipterygia]
MRPRFSVRIKHPCFLTSLEMPRLSVPAKVGWREEFSRICEGEPESPLSHKNTRPVKEEEKLPVLVIPAPREPRPSYRTAINRLTTRQVLLENTYKCHTRFGTHYQYTRFFLRPRDTLPDELLISPRFVRRVWKVDSGIPRPKWIDHESFKAFSISTFSVHALESEVRLCQTYYADKHENQVIGNKLLAWAEAVAAVSVGPSNDEGGSIWPAQTPPRQSPQARSVRAHAVRIHHNVF